MQATQNRRFFLCVKLVSRDQLIENATGNGGNFSNPVAIGIK